MNERFAKLAGIIFIILLIVGCEIQSFPTYPPPGFRIVCNITAGHSYYAAQYIGSGWVIEEDYNGKRFKTRQAAIDRAWEQYEWELENKAKVELKYKWKECK